jgi:TDG/mug DNA glycosylase family protein
VAAAAPIPDLLGPDLLVLFCGINPGLRSAELGQHFARPGNRFWKLLHAGGFTDRVLSPGEQGLLPSLGIGITNLVDRPTAAASELTAADLRSGGAQLAEKVRTIKPRCVAVLGMQAYRTAFARPTAEIGCQGEPLHDVPDGPDGPDVPVWLLPNPSGLQARYQLPEMTEWFRRLHRAVTLGGA